MNDSNHLVFRFSPQQEVLHLPSLHLLSTQVLQPCPACTLHMEGLPIEPRDTAVIEKALHMKSSSEKLHERSNHHNALSCTSRLQQPMAHPHHFYVMLHCISYHSLFYPNISPHQSQYFSSITVFLINLSFLQSENHFVYRA